MRRIERLPTYGYNLRAYNRSQNRKPSLTPAKPQRSPVAAKSTDQSPLQCGHGKRDHCGRSGSPWRRAIGVYWFSEQCGRELAALLCHRWTGESLSSLSKHFGLAHPDSSSNLIRGAKKRCEESQGYQRTVTTLERTIGLKTENQA